MIKNINSHSKYLTVIGGAPHTYINNYGGALQGVGNIRYNTNTQNIEVYDGSTWVTMNMGYADINLTPVAINALEWAEKKRNEELEREQLAQTNPAVKDLLAQIKEKEDQIKMVQTLIKKEVTA